MRIIVQEPPWAKRIYSVFPDARSRPVVFAWGDVIYNPHGVTIPPEIIAHESLHGERQLAVGTENWWEAYITDRDFRFTEELLAHVAEYQYILEHWNRPARRRALIALATRLSSPLYGKIITRKEAKERIWALTTAARSVTTQQKKDQNSPASPEA